MVATEEAEEEEGGKKGVLESISITQAVIGLCDNYSFIQSCNHLTGMNTLIHKILTMLAYILLGLKGASDDRRLSS